MFLLPVALLLAAVLVLYARTLDYGYIWDDWLYAASFQHYQWLDGIVRAATELVFASRAYYRPVAMFSFTLSPSVAAQHGINVLLHALNTVLVFLCAQALVPREVAESRAGSLAAAFGALVFAVHPMAVEPVAWVSGRFDTLMCSFVLGTCLVALGGELTRKRLALVFVLFACAMGSKESAIGLPVALPFMLLLKRRLAGGGGTQVKGLRVQLARLWAAMGLAVVLYAAVRLRVMHALLSGKNFVFYSDSVRDKFNVAAMAVTEFTKLLLNPWSHSAPLHPFAYEAGSGVLPQTVVVAVCVLALLATVFLKKPRLNFPLALLAALAMLWPALHLIGIPNGENIISDRYALAPLASLLSGLSATVGVWLARRLPAMNAGEKRAVVYAGVFGLLWAGALAAHTNATIPLWRDEVSFWTFVYRQTPDSERANKGYIRALAIQERWEEARAELDAFWKKYPGALQRLTISDITNCMLVSAKSGDYKEALAWSELAESGKDKLAQVSSGDRSAFYGVRGRIAAEAGEWNDAAAYLEKSTSIEYADRQNILWYAYALFMTGQQELAEEVFNRALAGSTKDLAAWALEWRKTWGKE